MKSVLGWLLAIAVVSGVAYYYWWRDHPQPTAAPISEVQPAPADTTPKIEHPIEEAQPEETETAAASAPQPLPELDSSDEALAGALSPLFGARFADIFFPKDLIRRIVATLDNLPRERVTQRLLPVKPVPGHFIAEGGYISGQNYLRYTPYVELVEEVDVNRLVTVYVHFYPLFQQAYRQLGYPDGYFNDRLIVVIDNLLAAPDVSAPLLVQPSVAYQYADPRLEDLSAGQKMLVRMGPNYAAAVKAKLRAIRARLVRGVPKSS